MLKASLENKMIYLIRQNRDSKIRDFNNHATKQSFSTFIADDNYICSGY